MYFRARSIVPHFFAPFGTRNFNQLIQLSSPSATKREDTERASNWCWRQSAWIADLTSRSILLYVLFVLSSVNTKHLRWTSIIVLGLSSDFLQHSFSIIIQTFFYSALFLSIIVFITTAAAYILFAE